jgi:hypothetical protein
MYIYIHKTHVRVWRAEAAALGAAYIHAGIQLAAYMHACIHTPACVAC